MAVQLQSDDKTRDVKDSELPGVPDGDKNTVYTIRDITKAKYREVIRRHTKKVANRHTRAMVEETDQQAVADELLDWALVGWKGITLHGEEMPCMPQYKAMLDSVRSAAILDAAGIGQVEEGAAQRQASFREPSHVA